MHILALVLAIGGDLGPVTPPQDPRGHWVSTFSILPRISDLSGDVDTDIGVEYDDLWKTGIGLSIESGFLSHVGKSWYLGLYLSTGFDVFSGDEFTDDVGDTLEADPLFVSNLHLGFKAALMKSHGFYFNGRIGIGATFWSAAKGDLTLSGVETSVTIFDPGVTFSPELAAHVGFGFGQGYLAAGFVVRGLGEPQESDDLAFEGTSPAVLAGLELELGFRF